MSDESGRILSEGRSHGANLHSAGELEVEKVLHEVMEAALDHHSTRPTAVCLGIAGVDREDDAQVIRAIMRRISPGSRVLVVNDALIALVAGVGQAPGIVVMSGTGSIAYGRNARAQAARSGGWGHVMGDEGSGYWIGRHAVLAVVRALDGRGPRTRLSEGVFSHFGVADTNGLVRVVYGREAPRMSVATLGPIVQQARDAGDAVAAQILERAAEELTLAAGSVASRLEMRGAVFEFILAGGVFRAVPWLVDELKRRLLEVAPRSQIRLLVEEPALGAVSLALEEARGGASLPPYI
jgi:N-acetylglucosamine kinase-like BadF-type ATPase